MSAGEIIVQGLGAVIRVLWKAVFAVVIEVAMTGVGRTVIRVVRPRAAPSDLTCALVGLVSWVAIGVGLNGLLVAAWVGVRLAL